MSHQSVSVKALRPTQIAVGMKLVKAKRRGLHARLREPQELVDFILDNPMRVVAGPKTKLYVIDHHHLAFALLEEGFKTAPVVLVADLSTLPVADFWAQMEAKGWLYPFDGDGRKQTAAAIPRDIEDMQDDPYRSLAGFVRQEGGFLKSPAPYAEFAWADYYRPLIARKLLKRDFDKAVRMARKLAGKPEAAHLPGFIADQPKRAR
ncbi:ParB-like protein [Aestuariivirga litoralis]|uniref:ParB-like protein n=1 Tax=Aestuariivirga litoralis TaxID=2650924 RepID=UPI0018C52798|nr:ParB-like protein [Aestuariivirga litoralis]MBG1233552.1 chromosome partitioning protein ParB [Aestuariivirga litoralis]